MNAVEDIGKSVDGPYGRVGSEDDGTRTQVEFELSNWTKQILSLLAVYLPVSRS